MSSENRWLNATDEDLLEAEENISDYTEDGRRAILEEVERRKNGGPSEGAARQKSDGSSRERDASSLAGQLEKRYRDAYRVARATIMAADFVKFVGIVFVVVGVVAAFLVAKESAPGAVAVGVVGASTGILIFGVGVLIAAQGQQLLASVDDVIGSSPFLTDVERAEVMRINL